MAAQPLPDIDPSYGTDMTQRPRRKRLTFGDGYTSRKRHGINSNPQAWNVVWENISEAEGETLRAFFEDQGGVDIVLWTPFGQADELKFSNDDFRLRPSGYGVVTCSVQLEQEFDL